MFTGVAFTQSVNFKSIPGGWGGGGGGGGGGWWAFVCEGMLYDNFHPIIQFTTTSIKADQLIG